MKIKKVNNQHMRERMRALRLEKDDPALAIIAAEHEQVVSSRLGLSQDADNAPNDDNRDIYEIAVNGLYIERVLIQQMLEAGRLSWKTAKEMQANITMLEAQLQIE